MFVVAKSKRILNTVAQRNCERRTGFRIHSIVQTHHFEIDIHSRMATLGEEITVLNAETEGYELDLKDATSTEEKCELRGLIKSCCDNLTETKKRKNAQSAGTPIVVVQGCTGIYTPSC